MTIRRILSAVLLAGLAVPVVPSSRVMAEEGLDLGGLKDFISKHILGDEARQMARPPGKAVPAARGKAAPDTAVPLPRPRPANLAARNGGAPASAGGKAGTQRCIPWVRSGFRLPGGSIAR